MTGVQTCALPIFRPQVLVKGGDYTEETVVGAPFVRSYGGEVALVPLVPGRSTTSMVTKMSKTKEAP